MDKLKILFSLAVILCFPLHLHGNRGDRLSLPDLLKESLLQHPSYKREKLTNDIVEIRHETAKKFFYPTLTGIGEGLYEKYPLENSKTTMLGLRLSSPLFDLSQWRDIERTSEERVAAKIGLEKKEVDLIYELSKNYIDLMEAFDQEEVSRENKDSLEQYVLSFGKRFRLGDATKTDIKSLQSKTSLGRNSWLIDMGSLERQRMVFTQITGVKAPLKKEMMSYPLIREASFLTLSSEEDFRLLNQNYGLQKLREEVTLSELSISKKESDCWPKVFFTAELLEHRKNLIQEKDKNRSEARILVSLEWSLFEWGKTKSQVEELTLSHKSLELQWDEERRKMASELFGLKREIYYLGEAYNEAILAKTYSLEALNGVMTQFRSGTRTVLDISNAQDTVLEAKKSLVSIRYKLLRSKLQYLLLTGKLSLSSFLEKEERS